ncbi:PAN domain protein, partial [Ostertagia ostertagi]
MSSSRCTFMRLPTAGYTDIYDEIVSDVSDAEECERLCVVQANVGDPCRHYDGRGSGRSPLSTRNSNLTYGSLDDCIESAECRYNVKGRRMVRVLKEYPSPREPKLPCLSIRTPTGCSRRDVSKTVALKCRNDALEIHGSSMRLFSTKKIMYTPTRPSAKPRYSLRVLNLAGMETDVVEDGDQGWLSLTATEGVPSQISVSNVIARDINTKETIKLINDDGCVVHHSILGISRPSPHEVRYKINFGGFHEQ